MILITGTGRSGTTFLASVLADAGIDIGPANGFKEHIEAIAIDISIMHARGFLTWVNREEIACSVGDRIRAVSNPALKSTALGHTLDVWRTSRDDLSIILCHRRLDGSTASFLKAYPRGQLELMALGYPSSVATIDKKAWLTLVFGQLMDVIMTFDLPHVIFRFPADLTTPQLCYDRVSPILKTLIGRDAFTSSFRRIADPQKVHSS